MASLAADFAARFLIVSAGRLGNFSFERACASRGHAHFFIHSKNLLLTKETGWRNEEVITSASQELIILPQDYHMGARAEWDELILPGCQ
jgi:hypothetical protein